MLINFFVIRFLYADPTRSALQVLSKNTSGANQAVDKLPVETGAEVGTWINADPIEGCVVVNIGESALSIYLYNICEQLTSTGTKCGRSGRTACIRAPSIVLFTEAQIIGASFTNRLQPLD